MSHTKDEAGGAAARNQRRILLREAERRLRRQLRGPAPRRQTVESIAGNASSPLTGSGWERVERWFARRQQAPFAFQRDVWTRYLAGDSGLVHASTGTGKTFAVWLGAVIEAIDSAATLPTGLQVLWITPMRALAADTARALEEPLAELDLPWSVALRTGDTSGSQRAAQERKAPAALVTTPESLTLLLTRADHRKYFGQVRLIVVDEWHELLGSKRGVQVQLALARLRRIAPSARVWGLSATLGNLDVALDTLLAGQRGQVVRGSESKSVVIDTLLPRDVRHFPWAGHLGIHMVREVAAEIANAGTTLVFTNVRSQAEAWYQALLQHRPDWAGQIALHHGSLAVDVRRWVEQELHAGRLRAVVCTSSLDLGVDFAPVERVIQIGSPKGIARLLQRAGRSGHNPGRVSRVTCVPTHALELLEPPAVRNAVARQRIESRTPPVAPLDVLVQHLVTCALGGGFQADDLFGEIRSAPSYRTLSPEAWRWALDFVTRGGALAAYPEYRRVAVDETGRYHVDAKAIAYRHRAQIGTIVSDTAVDVQYVRGSRIGQVEESFIARLRAGDCFVIAGRLVEFVRLREMTAWVRRARGKRPIIPRWLGGRLALSGELAAAFRLELQSSDIRTAEGTAVAPLIALQRRLSRIPAPGETLIELHATRDGFHLCVFTFAGRHANAGLAALAAWRLARAAPRSFSLGCTDYGFELTTPDEFAVDEATWREILTPQGLDTELPASINAAELARRQFREIARIAGLVFQGYPGAAKSARQLQASSGLIYDVFQRYDPDNPLLQQAQREVLERELDIDRLRAALTDIVSGRLAIERPARMTPLALPLIAEQMRARLSTEALAERVARMQAAMQKDMR